MQQALVAIHAFGRKGIKAVQVETPRKDINQSGDREDPSNYDFDTLWDINPDNESNRENRCREIESANFSDLILRDNIRTLVKEYDYAAASILAEQCKSIPDEASNLINGCKYRIMLDSSRAIPFFKGTSHTYNPANTLSEYVSMLETHIERKQWGDYLRATTPAITEILFRKVRTYLNDDKWTKQVPKRDRIVLVVDSDKVANIPELKFTLAKVREESEVNDHVLTLVLRQYLDKSEFDPYDKLRDMESKVRNPVAHEIRPINKESIERIAGLSLEESLRIMLRLSGTKPGLYKRINQDILDLIK